MQTCSHSAVASTTGNIFIRQMCSGDKSHRCDQERERQKTANERPGGRIGQSRQKSKKSGPKTKHPKAEASTPHLLFVPKKRKKKKNQPRVRRQVGSTVFG